MSKDLSAILADTRGFIAAKQASFNKTAAEQALSNPSAIPGSNHDSDCPKEKEQSDPEVKQELPPNTTSTNSGAGGAEKIESGHATDATQPISGVKKEPLETSDAMAGTSTSTVGDQPSGGAGGGAIGGSSRSVGKQANDLLASIRQFQETKQAGTPAAEAAPVKSAECDCGKEDCEYCGDSDDKGEAKAANELELTQDVLAKIAAMVLSTEEGWDFVESTMSKAAGAEAARETIGFLTKQAEDSQNSEAYNSGAAYASEYIKQACYEAGAVDALTQLGIDPSVLYGEQEKVANHDELVDLGRTVAEEAVKAAQELGVDEAGAPAVEGDVPGAEEAAGDMIAPDAGMGGEEEVTPEELEQALAMLIAEGQIGEEEAGQIMEYLSGAGEMEGAADEAEMAGIPDEAAGVPDEAAGMEVEASAKVKSLAAAISATVKQANAAK